MLEDPFTIQNIYKGIDLYHLDTPDDQVDIKTKAYQ